MIRPGPVAPGTLLRLTIAFTDDAGAAVDPSSVSFSLMSEEKGRTTTYVYGVDTQLGKASVGNYYADITPDHGGRWFYRWVSSGGGTTFTSDESFIVQVSPFVTQPGYVGDCT